MDIQLIQEEVSKIKEASYAQHSDKQLLSYETLYELYLGNNKGVQPYGFVKYNNPQNRICKLNPEIVKTIRRKYVPHVYGKERLAKEYGVSRSVILRIIRGESWKDYFDSG